MIRVGLARTKPTYAGVAPPYDPSPDNHVYAAVTDALRALGLDRVNPFGTLVEPGRRVVLKPNFIRHWNPETKGTVESVITHGAIVRAVADYAWQAVGPEGSVAIAEAPQQDCDFERIREIAGLDALVAHYAALGRTLEIIDLRRETVRTEDHVIVERSALPGDPAGYRAVDLGNKSCFTDSGLDPSRFSGADYDPGPTAEHHSGGRHAYLLSETVLRADLVVNLPKLKTHKKTGVTLALKNLVGINGDKNWLPHHTVGAPDVGGDEFPGGALVDRARSAGVSLARRLLMRGRGVRFLRMLRRAEIATRGNDFIRSGNWYGNRTTWRMCVDLNKCLYYSDANGFHPDAGRPVRTVLTLLDGVIAGEGEGPLAPLDVPAGLVLAATDPVALDLATVRLMGFDEKRLPKVWEPMGDSHLRITQVETPEDVVVGEVATAGGEVAERTLDALTAARTFLPHAGWQGHVERE